MFDWITSFIEATGLAGIALMMLAENVFPPIPSEIIMPLAGFSSASGEMNVFLAVAAGMTGSLAGAVFWYWIGLRIGAQRLKRWSDRHGRWLTLSPEEIDRSCQWFNAYGGWAVLIGRLIPGVRTFISVPAGVAGMRFLPFLAYSAIGTLVWTALLAAAGYLLESRYEQVSHWLGPVSTIVIAGIVAWYLYRVATFKPRRTA